MLVRGIIDFIQLNMLYGILLESVRDGICLSYGCQVWKKIVQELNLEHESFTTLGRYDDNLIERIAECKEILFFKINLYLLLFN